MNDGERALFKAWRNQLAADRVWQAQLTFSSAPLRQRAKTIRAEIKEAEQFEKRLKKFCSDLKFDVESKEREILNDSVFELSFSEIPTGLVPYDSAPGLTDALKASKKHRESLATLLTLPIGTSKNIPSELAIHLLVALELFSKSQKLKLQLKKFIEPRGILEKWLFNLGLRSSFIVATGVERDLTQWSASKRQQLERSIIGKEKKVDKPSVGQNGLEYERLRKQVKARAKRIEAGLIKV